MGKSGSHGSVASKVAPFLGRSANSASVPGPARNTPADPVGKLMGTMPTVADSSMVRPTASPKLDASDMKSAR